MGMKYNMKLIDLSYVIDNEVKIHPYDSPAFLIHDKFLDKDGYNNYRLEIGLHTGTHIDTPMHLTESKKYINDYELNKFCGSAKLIDVRGEDIISYKENYADIIDEDDIVLFYTGHDKQYDKKEYFINHPVMDIELAAFLVSKKIKMAGFDLPSPDRFPFLIHKKLLENGIMIIENLRNLKELAGRKFEFYAFPLNIKADSSPVRAAAKII